MPIVSSNGLVVLKTIKNKDFYFYVAYKNDIGDTRIHQQKLAKRMMSGKANRFYDPYVDYWEEIKTPIKQNLNFSKKYDAIILTVAHSKFKNINYKKILHLFKKDSHFIDLTNSLTKRQFDHLNSFKIKISFIG